MKVTFTQSGGFAGLSRGTEVDTTSLPRNEADELGALLRAADDSMRGGPMGGPGGLGLGGGPRRPDATGYVIKIEDGGAAREMKLSDMTMTDEAAALVQWLAARSKPRRP